jgi:hypothetical protein
MWRRRAADMSMLTTEALALFMIGAALAAGAGGDGPSFVTVCVAMFGGFYLVRFLLHFDTGKPALIGTASALSVVTLLALLNLQYNLSGGPLSLHWFHLLTDNPDAFLSRNWPVGWGVIMVSFAWFRAVTVAQRELTYQAALASYSVGLVMVVTVLLLGQGSRAEVALDAAALPYFMLGLLTLSLVHLSRAEYNQGDFLRGPWLLTLAGTVGTLTVISAAIGLFPIDLLNTLLAPVGNLVLRLLDVVILIIALPIGLLVSWLINLFTGGRGLQFPQSSQPASDTAEELRKRAAEGGPPEFLVIVAKTIFIMALFSGVAYLVWRFFRRLYRPLRSDEETRESLSGEGGLGDDLGALLSGLLGRFRRPAGEQEPLLPDAILMVRRLYVRTLRRAEAAGTPRPAAATPGEFAPALAETLATPAALRLSDGFAAARYGLSPPSAAELAELDRDLGRGA